MSTAELKSNLHKLIVETDDDSILQKVQDFFSSIRKESIVKEELSAYEKQMIEQGLKDFENGDVVSNEEVKQQFKTWINEKRR